jgi:hypothetical protein
VADWALTEAERALLEGAAVATQDLDLWLERTQPLERILASKRTVNRSKDRAQIPVLEAALAARREREGK